MLSGETYIAKDLKGLKSVRVMQITSTLVMGLAMLPVNMNKTFAEFYQEVIEADVDTQRKILEDAIRFVELSEEELLAVLCFCADSNGIAISKSNIGNYEPNKIMDMVVEVCLGVLAIDVFFYQKRD